LFKTSSTLHFNLNHGKFQLLTTLAFIGFQENIQQFIAQVETNLKSEGLIIPLVIIPINNVQRNVNHKFDFNFFMQIVFSMKLIFQCEQFFQ
jgi:hypothetical protein